MPEGKKSKDSDYFIKLVDTDKAAFVGVLANLHDSTFGGDCPFPSMEGWWWLVEYQTRYVGFAGLHKASTIDDAGYLIRSGITSDHRGNGLQVQLIKVREKMARKQGMKYLISDTRDNVYSANNLIKCGYKQYKPDEPWGYEDTIYWRKKLGKGTTT